MKGSSFIIIGGGGHSKVIIDALLSTDHIVEAIFDDNPSIQHIFGIQNLGSLESMVAYEKKYQFLIGIGDNLVRKKISEKFKLPYGVCIHKSSICSSTALIQEGTVILHGAIVQPETRIGQHCIINTGSKIDHDCIIGNFVHIAPGAVLCGNVQVGDLTLIGAGAVIINNLSIGKNCIIGAGSVVLNDIPDNSVVVGVPGKVIKQNAKT
jgi:sugar O-acyltransferase (sialic acid O-acetyltransferase NeuD family)